LKELSEKKKKRKVYQEGDRNKWTEDEEGLPWASAEEWSKSIRRIHLQA